VLPDIKIVELFHIGPIHLRTFGLLVAIGLLAGRALTLHRAEEAGITRDEMDDMIFYILVPAFIFAHLVEAVFYHPELISREGPVYLLKIWKGLSSFGGFFGGLLGYIFYVYRKKVSSPLIYAECILQGLVLGWVFGRLGCTVVFDHPGELSNFFLAFQTPEGARHNLGFYEFLFTALILLPTILILHRLKAKPGSYSAAVLILYTPVRFFLDFLRLNASQNGDVRYLGLTPGQYGSMILFVLGVIIAIKLSRTPPSPIVPVITAQPSKPKKKRKK
jgi:phosphatidylglycerol---prolipoprotein diacylglyceryl transferase